MMPSLAMQQKEAARAAEEELEGRGVGKRGGSEGPDSQHGSFSGALCHGIYPWGSAGESSIKALLSLLSVGHWRTNEPSQRE